MSDNPPAEGMITVSSKFLEIVSCSAYGILKVAEAEQLCVAFGSY